MKRSARWIWMVAAVTLLVAVVAAVVLVGLRGREVAADAAAGKAQATAGAKSLAAQDTTAAASQFASAKQSFESVKRSLGPAWVAGVAGGIPWAGRQYKAVQTLADIGLDGSTAGIALARALQTASASSSATAGSAGGFAALMANGHGDVDTALTSLASAVDSGARLSADGLVPQLAKQVRSAKALLEKLEPFLNRSRALWDLKTYLLSEKRRILIVSQNGAELRPTGGFVGSFGIVDVTPNGVKIERYRNVYALPDPPGRVAPPLGARMTGGDFRFRDANWWIDFPTSARAMLGFWRTYRQPPVDAIIAVDTVAMKDLLGALGPVRVPSYGETFTSKNLLERLLYLVEVNQPQSGDKKDVIVALAGQLEKRLMKAKSDDLMKSARALGKAADAKHVQMYFVDPKAQAAAEALGWSGKVAPPPGTTDVVAISNAMNKGGKANVAVKKTIDYEVALQPDRSAETTLVLSYANTGQGLMQRYAAQLGSLFRNWLRVYRTPGTVFPGTTPEGDKTMTTEEFGFPAEIRTFTLRPGQSTTETLTAVVPDGIQANSAQASGGRSHYRLYLVRQADLQDIPTTVAVRVPEGWKVTGASARLIASGAALPVTTEGAEVRMEVPLTGDLELDVQLAAP